MRRGGACRRGVDSPDADGRLPWVLCHSQGATVIRNQQREPGAGDGPIPAVVFLSGSRRGETLRLKGDTLRVGTDPDSEIRIPADTEPIPLPHHATLRRRGHSYEINSAPGARVWVNGELLERLVLASGDVLEIGRDGAVLRFRLYDRDTIPYKSLAEIFSDCAEGRC